MPVTYNIKDSDLSDAESFLTQFLTEKVTEANFQIGSAMRDLAVKAFTYIYAYLRGEIDNVRLRQSIYRISTEGANLTDVDQSIDEILSNWFMTRKAGTLAAVTAVLHFTERTSVSIPITTRFWKTSALAFYVNSISNPYVISESEMKPRYDNRGNLVDYSVNVPLRASRSGDTYNLPAGRFFRVEVLNGGVLPYFSFAENTSDIAQGASVENSTDLVTRSQTAIAVRNLINNRSVDATLQDNFAGVSQTLTVGMGEPEMMRDRRRELASHIELHIGGHYDIYAEYPEYTAIENCLVGGYFPRPDNVINVFRDPALTYGTTVPPVAGVPFTAGANPVVAGDVIYINSGITGTPRAFPIVDVTDHELLVSAYCYFSEASDELGVAVNYSVGQYSPTYDDKIGAHVAARSDTPAYSSIPEGTSRHVQSPGKVLLSGLPVQDILTVEITDPASIDSGLVNPGTGTILFSDRTNLPPVVGITPLTMQYQVSCPEPHKYQSIRSMAYIDIGTKTEFQGKNLRVAYLSAQGITDVHNFALGRTERICAANPLPKVRTPIWIEAIIPYRLKPTSTTTLDEKAAAANLAKFINAFDPNDDLDVSDIATQLRVAYPGIIGTVYNTSLQLNFYLHTPDGQVITYNTTDIVSIFMDGTNGVSVTTTGINIIVPTEMQQRGITNLIDPASTTNTEQNFRDFYTVLGISDRTVKYRTRQDLISFTLRS